MRQGWHCCPAMLMDGSAAPLPQAGWLLCRGAGLTFFSHCLKRDSRELCGQVCLRLGNKRGIFALLAGLLLELQLLWSQ